MPALLLLAGEADPRPDLAAGAAMTKNGRVPDPVPPREQLCERGREWADSRSLRPVNAYPAFASSRWQPVPHPPQSGGGRRTQLRRTLCRCSGVIPRFFWLLPAVLALGVLLLPCLRRRARAALRAFAECAAGGAPGPMSMSAAPRRALVARRRAGVARSWRWPDRNGAFTGRRCIARASISSSRSTPRAACWLPT